jgi:CheY-like chemotaxis protein
VPHEGRVPTLIHAEDEKHAEFLRDADLVIHDSQYTAAEYGKKVGWGHSTMEYVVDVATAAGVKRLALFHHDPLRHDDAVDIVLQATQARQQAWGQPLLVIAASEGATLDLPERTLSPTEAPGEPAPFVVGNAERPKVLIVDNDPDLRDLVALTLREEGYELLSAEDGKKALEAAHLLRPDLILLDWETPEMSGPEVCQALRTGPDVDLRDVPIVLVTVRTGDLSTREGFEAGANDYLTKPFTPAHLRARVREWLTRGRQAHLVR